MFSLANKVKTELATKHSQPKGLITLNEQIEALCGVLDKELKRLRDNVSSLEGRDGNG